MDDLISRKAVVDALNECTEFYLNNLPTMIYKTNAVDAVKALPSAERHARWQYIDYGGVGNWHCTACREITINATFYKYCPHCGAIMEGEQHE